MIFTDQQQALGRKVLEALEGFFRSHDLEKASMAYSGGLDSSVLLALGPRTVVPYTLGDEGSRDYSNSSEGSSKLGFKAVSVPLALVDLDKYVEIVRAIDPGIRKKDLGYEVVLAILLDNMREDEVITGQGADEIFYGYGIFRENTRMDNSLHMKKLYGETLPREAAIAEYFGKKLITPYLSSGIQGIMEKVERETNFTGECNKAVLRSAAILAGMPLDIAARKKTAAQYGSGLMKKIRSTPIWKTFPQ